MLRKYLLDMNARLARVPVRAARADAHAAAEQFSRAIEAWQVAFWTFLAAIVGKSVPTARVLPNELQSDCEQVLKGVQVNRRNHWN